tara:strand:- start:4224 stop:5411 length:1188 start_codon:yes stop_codon:yes gene_type:complete
MDDYNVNVLSEAKNEYSSRLVTILTPLLIEGVKSIFDDAFKLCIDNDEEEKYLMTFQNFLARVPKWNDTIIENETQRIINSSGCKYLDDLITCVHITQLKVLTSIRVSNKQKKINLDIPKLHSFIHKCYVLYARKLYTNVYLYEQDILPLQYQKNMRENTVLCQESILEVIRESMPIEKILRAYIDETTEEEITEELIEEDIPEEDLKEENETSVDASENELNAEQENVEENLKPLLKDETELVKKSEETSSTTTDESHDNNSEEVVDEFVKDDDIKDIIEDLEEASENIDTIKVDTEELDKNISFDDNDKVLDMGSNEETIVSAPKTIERLEEISEIRNNERKEEEEMEEDYDDDEGSLKISNEAINLNSLNIMEIKDETNLKDSILSDIKVLE